MNLGRAVLVSVALALAAAVSAQASTPTTVSTFITWETQNVSHGNWNALWSRLDPLQRAHVPEALYAKCQAKVDPTLVVTKVTINGTKQQTLTLPGTGKKVATTAVSITLVIKDATTKPTAAPDTQHLIRATDGGFWTGLTLSQFTAFAAGHCPP